MIIFSGDISDTCKKNELRKARIVSLIFATTTALGLVLSSIIIRNLNKLFFGAVALGLFFITASILMFTKKQYGSIFPTKVVIDNDIVYCEGDNFKEKIKVAEVKKIVDFGEWYKIYSSPYAFNTKFICQKDLLAEGTIEEFENMFEGFIVRKIKNM